MQGWSLASFSSTLESISTEFLTDQRQGVVVDGAASEWIPIISAVPQGSVLGTFCLSYIPAKCLSYLRTDYLPMQMTSHYWQLFTVPLLSGIWLGFRSGAITGVYDTESLQ